MKRADYFLAAALCIATTAALLFASRSQGFTRDEGYYFSAAEQHVAYYEEALDAMRRGRPLAFTDRRLIDRWFSYNNEHPALMKTLFGLSFRLLHRCRCPEERGLHPRGYPRRHRTLGLLSQGEAMRLPAHVLAGLLVAAIYLFAARLWGRGAGLCAAGLTILAPRHFFHAQLASFDAPIAAMICFTTLSYYMAQVTGRRAWLVATGVLAGLSIATKHNAFFLPFVLLVHSLWIRRGMFRGGPSGALRAIFAPFALAMALLSIPVYLLTWPHLWHDTARRFGAYVAFHLHHVYYNIEYLGQNHNRPPFPWDYVPVTTLLTAPVTTLALALMGAAFAPLRMRKSERAAMPPAAGSPGLLIALGLFWPMLLIMKPGTPIFGAEKHWLPAIPFLALAAGYGYARLSVKLPRPLCIGLAVMLLVPPLLEVRRSHPYGLSHYNALAGGPAGGADLGMNRQFWGYAVRGLFPYLNEKAPFGSALYWHDANAFQLQMSVKDGLLRPDLRDTGLEEPGVRAADLALVIHERHFNKYEYWIWDAFGTTRPSAVLAHEGVPIVTLYTR